MAYLKGVDRLCDLCKRRPIRVALFDRYNNLHGEYCRTCGKRREQELQAREDRNG